MNKEQFNELCEGINKAIMSAKPKQPMGYVETVMEIGDRVNDYLVEFGKKHRKG